MSEQYWQQADDAHDVAESKKTETYTATAEEMRTRRRIAYRDDHEEKILQADGETVEKVMINGGCGVGRDGHGESQIHDHAEKSLSEW